MMSGWTPRRVVTRLMGWLSLLTMPLAGQNTVTACTEPASTGPETARLDRLLRAATSEGFAGAVVVARRDTILLCRGYGTTAATGHDPITPTTNFFVASITKQFTAAAVLRLVARGRITLQDSLGRFFPDLPHRARQITIDQLLTHRAGLRDNYRADGIVDRDSAMIAIFGDPSRLDPPGQFAYTNDAYAALAAIIEVVAHESWESFIARELLRPAGIHDAGFWGLLDDRDSARVAQKLSERSSELSGPHWGYRGSSGLWLNAIGLYRWFRAAWRGHLLAPTNQATLLATRFTLPSGLGIGYGTYHTRRENETEIWTRGEEDFGHNGVIRWFPAEDLVVIVVSRVGQLDGTGAHRVVSDRLLRALRSRSEQQEPPR